MTVYIRRWLCLWCGNTDRGDQRRSGPGGLLTCRCKRCQQAAVHHVPWSTYTRWLEAGCAICGAHPPNMLDGRVSLHIDHDHACCPGTFSCGSCARGLLCHHCNHLVDGLERKREHVQRALAYLD